VFHVQRHLPPADARRQEFERIARKVGIAAPDHPLLPKEQDSSPREKADAVKEERRKIVNIVRAASSVALREHVRLGSFRNVVVITAMLMAVLAFGVALTGFFRPTLIPMCLDTSAQILAWALVFGYAQQLFTRLVDQQGQTILDNVRGADRPQPAPDTP
jgi:hypothetical protein